MVHIYKDPCKGVGDERLAAIVKDYKNLDLSLSDIAMRYRIGKDRITQIAKAKGLRMRNRDTFMATLRSKRKKRTIAQVFMGVQTPKESADPQLEAAKTVLRQRGCIVYDATVTDGSAAKDFVKCDGKRFTREQIIRLASMRRAA